MYCFTTSVCHGVANYFPRLWGTGISDVIFTLNVIHFMSSGKVVGGFEIINNLISKKLVIREATNRLTYALRPAGVELAKRLMKYHNAVISVMKENSVPCVPELQPGK